MKRVSITEAKNQLSALLDLVKAGEDLIIEERGRPIARVQAIGTSHTSSDGRRERLIRAGVLIPKRSPETAPRIIEKLVEREPVKIASGASVLAAHLEERAEGR